MRFAENRIHTIESSLSIADWKSGTNRRGTDGRKLSASLSTPKARYGDTVLLFRIYGNAFLVFRALHRHFRRVSKRWSVNGFGPAADRFAIGWRPKRCPEGFAIGVQVGFTFANHWGQKQAPVHCSLTTLNLRGQKLTTADATELGRTLISLQHLSALIISCTGIHCEQVFALATEMCRDPERRYVSTAIVYPCCLGARISRGRNSTYRFHAPKSKKKRLVFAKTACRLEL